MKTKTFRVTTTWRRVAGIASIAALAASPALAPAAAAAENAGTAVHGTPAAGKQLYQCPMHPNIVADHPGHCPICGMELQPVHKAEGEGIPGRAPVNLTAVQRQLINLQTTDVVRESVSTTIRAVGVVNVNQQRTAVLNSRVMGWVEHLYVDRTGETVTKGQRLLSIYSPDLLAAQQEYLIAWRAAKESKDPSLLEASRQRLLLWGVQPQQIHQLEKSGKPTATLDLFAPAGGTVLTKNVEDQQMVSAGMPLFRIADLSTVWVTAQIYQSEIGQVHPGQTASVTIPGSGDGELRGRVDFVYPYLNAKTRTNDVRLVFPNPEGRLKPEMYVNVTLRHALGERLTVPASAVFDTGLRQYVFVDRGKGLFEPVEVTLGPRSGVRQVILSGLQAGESVVVSGNFLLDSESQLKAAASGSPSENDATATTAVTSVEALPASAAAGVRGVMDAYRDLYEPLASDKTSGVVAAASRLRSRLSALETPDSLPENKQSEFQARLSSIKHSADAFSEGQDLEMLRKHFGALSAELIGFFQEYKPPLGTAETVFKCPMWHKSEARWIQTGKTARNPFLGAKMSTCGEVIGTIGGGK